MSTRLVRRQPAAQRAEQARKVAAVWRLAEVAAEASSRDTVIRFSGSRYQVSTLARHCMIDVLHFYDSMLLSINMILENMNIF